MFDENFTVFMIKNPISNTVGVEYYVAQDST